MMIPGVELFKTYRKEWLTKDIFAGLSVAAIALLGKAEGIESYQDLSEYKSAVPVSGLLIFRFESALLFFNADYFKNCILDILSKQKEKINCIFLDASSINLLDITAADTLEDLINELRAKGIDFGIARARSSVQSMLIKTGISEKIGKENIFDSVYTGVEFYLKRKKN